MAIPKIKYLHFSGLGDDPSKFDGNGMPTDPLCGARFQVTRMSTILPFDYSFVAWDDPDSGPGRLEKEKSGYDLLFCSGHSHGGWRLLENSKKLLANFIDGGYFIDECPLANPIAHLMPPIYAPLSLSSGVAVWQRNSEPSGQAFNSCDNFTGMDVSLWSEPRLGHIDFFGLKSIAGDNRVWTIILSSMLNRVTKFLATP